MAVGVGGLHVTTRREGPGLFGDSQDSAQHRSYYGGHGWQGTPGRCTQGGQLYGSSCVLQAGECRDRDVCRLSSDLSFISPSYGFPGDLETQHNKPTQLSLQSSPAPSCGHFVILLVGKGTRCSCSQCSQSVSLNIYFVSLYILEFLFKAPFTSVCSMYRRRSARLHVRSWNVGKTHGVLAVPLIVNRTSNQCEANSLSCRMKRLLWRICRT